MTLCYDLMEMIGENVVSLRDKKYREEHKNKFNNVIDCIYIDEDEMEEIDQDGDHQETCIKWMLEIRYYNVEETFIY